MDNQPKDEVKVAGLLPANVPETQTVVPRERERDERSAKN